MRRTQILEIDVGWIHDTRDESKLVYVVGRDQQIEIVLVGEHHHWGQQLDFGVFEGGISSQPRRRLIGLGVDLPLLTAAHHQEGDRHKRNHREQDQCNHQSDTFTRTRANHRGKPCAILFSLVCDKIDITDGNALAENMHLRNVVREVIALRHRRRN